MTTITEADVESADLNGWPSLGYLELYDPGVKLVNWRDYISSDPMICHGKACITGTRVMVTVIPGVTHDHPH